MPVTAISPKFYNPYITAVPETTPQKKISAPERPENPHIDRSIYSKGASSIPFTANTNLIRKYVYTRTLPKFQKEAMMTDVEGVRGYFQSLGIPFDMSGFPSDIQSLMAYCCFNTAEIYRQIHMPLPLKIMSYTDKPSALGVCWFSSFDPNIPIRSVAFNTNHDWTDYMVRYNNEDNWFSTGHFLHPFIHEFAHNINFDRIFSKYGCPCPQPKPLYPYNPNTNAIFEALNTKIYDKETGEIIQNNPVISDDVRIALKDSSGYGSTLLPETVAEEITRNIVNCLDLSTLRLERNPFPIQIHNAKLNQIVYEAWEGLICDGQGLI